MDNRRVFHSYKKKVKDATAPYVTPNEGLFSKMRSFFTRGSVWSSDADAFHTKNNDNESPSMIEGKGDESSTMRVFSFPEPDVSMIKTPLKRSADTSRVPNQVLSSFFQEKGERPLTDIEYEGVVSLLSKAKSASNTPNNSIVYRGESNTLSKQDDSIANSTYAMNNKEADSSMVKNSTSNLFVTPYSQRTLKNSDSNQDILSTPEYKPVYHSVNENFSSKNVPSVKRVYQFSGLPSPYRTRIRAPSLSRPGKVIKSSPSIPQSPIQKSLSKPISNTANSLLSILDGNTATKSDVSMKDASIKENNITEFSNPYHRPVSTKKPKNRDDDRSMMTPSKKNTTLLTARDINNTILFNKSEELPKQTNEPTNKFPSDTFDAISKKSEEKMKFVPNGNSSASKKTTENISKPDNFNFTANSEIGGKQETRPNKDLFTKVQPKKDGFEFGTVSKPSVHTNSSNSSNDNNSNNNNNNENVESFFFPEIERIEVKLDYNKVNKYKSLFEF